MEEACRKKKMEIETDCRESGCDCVEITAVTGDPLPLGVKAADGKVNFAVSVPAGSSACLILYRKGETKPRKVFPMKRASGRVWSVALEGLDTSCYEYNYQIGDQIVVDPYAKALEGKSVWGKPCDVQQHEVRGSLSQKAFDWEGDAPLEIPYHQVVAYSLHVRGFTKHFSSGVKGKGTFQGLIEKLPYLVDLGVNQIQCMPVYEFEECKRYTNYWGYGEAFCFAPKSAYAASKDPVTECKEMVKACHRAGIEVVFEMPFTDKMPKQMMEECLRYYVLEYHVDGFILNPLVAPMEGILADPILGTSKIMTHQTGFQTVMRRFLKGDEGMVGDVIYWLRHSSEGEGIFNNIAGHTGFTMYDMVSYDGKHNEANGEQNQDGPDYNYSWNCGAEGPTKKKTVLELRKKQLYNAWFLLLTAQGTPCILAGDEFANTQKGNNNVYCQDNSTAWLDWRKLEKEAELHAFVKALIRIRKQYPVFAPAKEMQGLDKTRCGVPDVSYHGESAWRTPSEVYSRQLGVYYSVDDGDGEKKAACFVAYNMHWLEHEFALPALGKNQKWYRIASTREGVLEKPIKLENQKMVPVEDRTVMLLAGM